MFFLSRAVLRLPASENGSRRFMGLIFGVASALALTVPAYADAITCSATTPVSTGCTNVATLTPTNNLITAFSGTFNSDDNIQIFQLTVTGGNEQLTVESFSYGGGIDMTGTTIVPPGPGFGGFATEFALFNSTGGFVTDSSISNCPMNGQQNNPATTLCYDNALSWLVGNGTYYLALTENNNEATGNNLFSSGTTVTNSAFSQGGNGDFTAPLCGGTAFCDPFGDQMDGSYDVDVRLAIPEPGSLGLVSAALALGLFLVRRRRTVLHN
jgi:hypothetical protein